MRQESKDLNTYLKEFRWDQP